MRVRQLCFFAFLFSICANAQSTHSPTNGPREVEALYTTEEEQLLAEGWIPMCGVDGNCYLEKDGQRVPLTKKSPKKTQASVEQSEKPNEVFDNICIDPQGRVFAKAGEDVFSMTVDRTGNLSSKGTAITPAIKSDLKDYYVTHFSQLKNSGKMIPEKEAFLRRELPKELFAGGASQPRAVDYQLISGYGCGGCVTFKSSVYPNIKQQFASKVTFKPTREFQMSDPMVRREFPALGSFPWVQIKDRDTGAILWEGSAFQSDQGLKTVLGKNTVVPIEDAVGKAEKSRKKMESCDSDALAKSQGVSGPVEVSDEVTGVKDFPALGKTSNGMWGLAEENGKKKLVPLYINPHDGTLMGGDKNQHRLSAETLVQLAKYYSDNRSKFTDERGKLVDSFLATRNSSTVALTKENPPAEKTSTPAKTVSQTRTQASEPSLSYLLPAGTDGDPGFQFATLDSKGFSKEGCRGTLVSATPGRCVVATAAHCFDGQGGARVVGLPDFGRVNANIVISPHYRRDRGGNDVAAMIFNCPQGPGKVPVVPLAQSKLQDGQKVYYASFKGATRGTLEGTIFRASASPVEWDNVARPYGHSTELVLSDLNKATQSGDSGTGLFVEIDGIKYLSGILSGSQQNAAIASQGKQHNVYSTNTSLDFLRTYIR